MGWGRILNAFWKITIQQAQMMPLVEDEAAGHRVASSYSVHTSCLVIVDESVFFHVHEGIVFRKGIDISDSSEHSTFLGGNS